jgi:hypothetical protein
MVAGSRSSPLWLVLYQSLLPTKSSSQSAPTPEDLLVLILPLTPGSSILKSFNALPLRRTTWYCCLPITPGIRMLSSPASSAGPCWFLLSRCLGFHSRGPLSISIGLHRLLLSRVASHPLIGLPRTRIILSSGCTAIHSRGSCQFRLPRTINLFSSLLAWLVVHSIGLPRTFVLIVHCCGPSGSSSTLRLLFFTET